MSISLICHHGRMIPTVCPDCEMETDARLAEARAQVAKLAELLKETTNYFAGHSPYNPNDAWACKHRIAAALAEVEKP